MLISDNKKTFQNHIKTKKRGHLSPKKMDELIRIKFNHLIKDRKIVV